MILVVDLDQMILLSKAQVIELCFEFDEMNQGLIYNLTAVLNRIRPYIKNSFWSRTLCKIILRERLLLDEVVSAEKVFLDLIVDHCLYQPINLDWYYVGKLSCEKLFQYRLLAACLNMQIEVVTSEMSLRIIQQKSLSSAKLEDVSTTEHFEELAEIDFTNYENLQNMLIRLG